MPRLHTKLTVSTMIDAPVAAVWRVLIDVHRYPEWNPYFISVSGDVVEGAVLGLSVVLGDKAPARARCQVLSVQSGQHLRWRSRFLLPGLIDADHGFSLISATPQRTELRQEETFTGLLVPLAPLDDVHRACAAMGEALRARVDARDFLA